MFHSEKEGGDSVKMRKLRLRRLEKRMTVGELAQQLGVTISTIWRWERGLGKPMPKFIPKLEELLGAPWNDLKEFVNGER